MFYDNWFARNEDRIWNDFIKYLSIPSISADPKNFSDLIEASKFIQGKLRKMGMNISIFDEGYAPLILAEKIVDENLPTIMIYGHYDVQPADPLHLWDSPPFSPTIRDEKIYARGAEDNKGQNFYSLLAIEAFLERNPTPNINIKVLIEGEEEIGSKHFEEIATKHKSRLKADYLWIVDMGIESYTNPVLSLGVRGIISLEVCLSNSSFDLHSGSYGGCVYNPIRALSEVIASFHDKEGEIAVKGFYDDVDVLSKEEKEKLYMETPQKVYEQETDATCFQPKPGFTLQESIGICPTIEINGIHGGYSGDGGKTIIPKEATAKITCRLVKGQDPKKIALLVKDHIEKYAPQGMKISYTSGGGGYSAWSTPNSRSVKVFSKIIEEITEKKCHFSYSGGSIPLTAILSKISGGEFIFLGTALPEDRIHAPNENFSKKQFKDGFTMIAKGLETFAENKKQC